MYGQPPHFNGHGGGRGQHPPQQPGQPFFVNYYQPPNVPIVFPNYPIVNPNFHPFPVENPNIHTHNFGPPIENPNNRPQNHNFPTANPKIHNQNFNHKPHTQVSNSKGTQSNANIEKIDEAVVKVRRDLVDAGENVSAWKVSQAAVVKLRADSWDSLGVQMQNVPSLFRLMQIEGKINAFINCFVEVWKIATLSDLEKAICKNEGVHAFEELELGPLTRHPLINHYFCVNLEATQPFRISNEEIFCHLVEFTDNRTVKDVQADELLDFVAKKRSVGSKEELHVRIRSLGMHIAFIQQAKPQENTTLRKFIQRANNKLKSRPLFRSEQEHPDENSSGTSERPNKRQKTHPLLLSEKKPPDEKLMKQKKQLDENFNAISERMKSFPLGQGKHTRFGSLSSEEDNDVESDDNENASMHDKNSSENVKTADRVSSCPYPSAIEERSRLGIAGGKEETPSRNVGVEKSKRKRKFDAVQVMARNRWEARGDDGGQDSVGEKISDKLHVIDMSLSKDSMMTFITLWKEACKGKETSEVFLWMAQFYSTCSGTKLENRRIGKMCQSYPVLGLINIAIESIKQGMWDSMYDALQTAEQEEPCTASKGHTDNVSIATDSGLVKQHSELSVEDIVKKVSEFFKDTRDDLGDFSSTFEKNAIFFRSLYKCEVWLTQQFVVENFESFGYGDFLTFLERNVSVLSPSFQTHFVTKGNKPSLEAFMSPELLDVLVAQALLENENLTVENVVELLKKQFPSIPFKLVNEESQKALEDVVKANRSTVSKGLLFSASLLAPRIVNSETRLSSKDAIEVLLKAPMLTDLSSWSHWDLRFAPSLGSLTMWLLNEMNTKEMLCLVTRNGNMIRIDHAATVDSFLEAFIHGSSFQTAVNLLSLFALYGGEKNLPLSLLKCHAEKGFKVIVKQFSESEVKDRQNHLMNDLTRGKSELDHGVASTSNFVLDCLAYLPGEFRFFAADLLLSGFRSVAKDAPSAILTQCRHTEHRLMLHELGLSLGIMEWIDDYHTFSFAESQKSSDYDQEKVESTNYSPAKRKMISSAKADVPKEERKVARVVGRPTTRSSSHKSGGVELQRNSATSSEKESAMIIESIRREEFGLDSGISAKEDSILKKQHARLGRALHCLSQELYSQDSHFLLELVQNADDNVYPSGVEPTLTFILQEVGVIVLNNEQGFSAENIKALCDVGNSTKKEPSAGYIGKKGIGFKSVFRVTDAPEIHSNGFHIKFDISDGQIGFVLPTVVPPCDIDSFSKLVSMNADPTDDKHWTTCIVLPFRSKKKEHFSVENLISMFSDLHPSLLLFLHRLECIKFRNLLNDSFIVMRKEVIGDGIVSVSLGKEKMTWFVRSQKLKADHIRHDVQTTEISMALMLEDLDNGNYIPKLDHQPVFAFLPLRNYGLKFIIQADFILPTSREEVDGDSPWNQWLLSEFPNLFVSAEMSFCNLPCFKENPGAGVSAFMSFVPLVGEVHGFFSCLPRMIISKLRMSNCLLLEGENNEWVPPCKVLRNWTEQTRSVLPDSLIREHLGVGYLNKDTVLTDSLARALGVEECGPRILLQIMTSLCHSGSLKSMGLNWLSSWLNVMYSMLVNVSDHGLIDSGTQSDVITSLSQLPFIPLMDGQYTSIQEGPIWLHTDTENGLEAFGKLYPKLRIVTSALFNDSPVDNVTQMLYKVGVQRLSAHEVLKVHILPVVSNEKALAESNDLMTEYLSFIMFHLDSPCPECLKDRDHILSQLCTTAFISTNHGYKRLVDVPIHFSKDFGNPINMSKLVGGTDMKWVEINVGYLEHPVYASSPGATLKWRKFLQELGVTDFVQIVKVEKHIEDISHTVLKNLMLDDDCVTSGSIITDWDSRELTELLAYVSSSGDREKGKYLLEVLDTLWDDYFSDKVTGFSSNNGKDKAFKASVIRILHGSKWVASSMDAQLHFSKDLFYNCEVVRTILGDTAPYAIPKVNNAKLLNDIGLKNTVSLDDALSVLEAWRRHEKPFKASISQMTKFYTFIWNEMSLSRQKIVENLHSQPFIFVPFSFGSANEVVSGSFLSPNEVFWQDSTGSMKLAKSNLPKNDRNLTYRPFSKMLCNIYPSLRYFFVNEFGVAENPPLLSYLQSLLQISTGTLPSQAAKIVFQVFKRWSDGLESGDLSSDDVDYLKKRMEENTTMILPTVQDNWVSLNQSSGLLCWGDDEQLRKEFKNLSNVDYLNFGELSTEEQQMLQDKVSVLLRRLGIPSLSEVVTREAMYFGSADSSFKSSLVSWALPYAQRYIYTTHPIEYAELKRSEFKNLNSLRIVVVLKLYYRNIIEKFGIKSSKRSECSCLLQDNTLYTTSESDTHSLFMEVSRFLIAGIPELPLANFLHMITTMAESGSTEEQMEFFITNSQKLSKLPSEEEPWFLACSQEEDENPPTTSSGLLLDESNLPKSTGKKRGLNSWPPVNWKSAPGFNYAVKTNAFNNPQTGTDVSEGLIETSGGWSIEETLDTTAPGLILEEDEPPNTESSGKNRRPVRRSARGKNIASTDTDTGISSKSIAIDQLCWGGNGTPQQVRTGRMGELLAFEYFSNKIREKNVRWVNDGKESGLPYDIVVEGKGNSKEYIEVKATSSATKDWFVISLREWQFAIEKGDSFSIARVVLLDGKLAQITTYTNPAKLCQSGHLQLAILSPNMS